MSFYSINLLDCIEHIDYFYNSQLLSSGAMRSVLQALMVRTARECVTVLTVLVATTSMEAACVSQVSMVRSAETGCVSLESMGCTVKTPVSARTNTHSGERLLLGDERRGAEAYSSQTFPFVKQATFLEIGTLCILCIL